MLVATALPLWDSKPQQLCQLFRSHYQISLLLQHRVDLSAQVLQIWDTAIIHNNKVESSYVYHRHNYKLKGISPKFPNGYAYNCNFCVYIFIFMNNIQLFEHDHSISLQDQSLASSRRLEEKTKVFHPLSTAAVMTCLFSVHIQTLLDCPYGPEVDVVEEHITTAKSWLRWVELAHLVAFTERLGEQTNLQMLHLSANINTH